MNNVLDLRLPKGKTFSFTAHNESMHAQCIRIYTEQVDGTSPLTNLEIVFPVEKREPYRRWMSQVKDTMSISAMHPASFYKRTIVIPVLGVEYIIRGVWPKECMPLRKISDFEVWLFSCDELKIK